MKVQTSYNTHFMNITLNPAGYMGIGAILGHLATVLTNKLFQERKEEVKNLKRVKGGNKNVSI
jgi:hypothetical protein